MAEKIIHLPTRRRMKAGLGSRAEKDFIQLGFPALDVTVWDDDFMGDQVRYDATAPGTYQSTASGTGSATAALVAGTIHGVIRLDPGTADDGRSDLSLGLHFRGDRNVVCWWRVSLPAAIGSMKFELGLTDVVSGTDAGAINVKATPSYTATDAVVLCLDTDDDTNLTLLGVAAGTGATAIDFNTTLAVSTDYYMGIALENGVAKGYLLDEDGGLIEQTASRMASAVTATTLLTPWAFVQNRSGSQRILDIDRLTVYQRRTTT
mgnify:FL=1